MVDSRLSRWVEDLWISDEVDDTCTYSCLVSVQMAVDRNMCRCVHIFGFLCPYIHVSSLPAERAQEQYWTPDPDPGS